MIISAYVLDMLVCVKEHTVPTAQLDELHELFDIIRKNPLPKTGKNSKAVRCCIIF